MLEDEGKGGGVGGGGRRTYSRSVSWTDRSPTKIVPNKKPPTNSKPRPLLPPLQPLSINKRSVEEWPSAGSDDLGIWPLPQTPRGSIKALEVSDSGKPLKEFQFKRDKLAFFDKECSRIAEHVYLGSDTVAKNHDLLRQNGITHVLNCVGFVCPEYFKSDFVYKTLWLQDSPTEDITSILYDVFDYFEDVREQGGRVLVHCCQGVSRSTSLVIAYLMWREGQSFEDAFQYVKTARGVTNPNMGFACQLLQCQKRVHAMPASPNSVRRMYRMAPHSPYDPLHLVPKMINHPGSGALDSRGAFIIHVPNAIYVWIGKFCSSMMSSNARAAACQVIRYERAKGPILSINEGEEPPKFWIALANESMEVSDVGIDGGKKVSEYDLDFEIFHKALAGGVVPPFTVSNAGSETCLPARENGWGRLRRKFASGIMKGLFTSSCSKPMIMEEENQDSDSVIDPPCGSPDSFECFPDNISERGKDTTIDSSSSSLPTSPAATSDSSFSCFLSNSPKFSSKSPTLSPSSSDYASSFTFSPSSTNWSDLSFVSSRQPSPSSLEQTDPFYVKEAVSSPKEEEEEEAFSGSENMYMPLKGSFLPSIAARRGSNPPPRMVLPSVNESSHHHDHHTKLLVRSHSFSLPDLDDDIVMKEDASFKQLSDHGNNEKEVLPDDADISSSGEWHRPSALHLKALWDQDRVPELSSFFHPVSIDSLAFFAVNASLISSHTFTSPFSAKGSHK
ncbi:protein-tyrosine-phosphatase MKP1-like isoform X1 [Senna tora]|uniref:Protein-tyrosine-phosphatase MKP1-like isoform X1 n=1 Tax=Senna tora TaxID=362788 RepID=A0A835C9S7_9FABA|nr:protein-tyrosine-phosphatase MKP1-like isoform X1 [Senna tora]